MINPQWLELSISLTKFQGPNDIQAIRVQLYLPGYQGCTDSRDISDDVSLQ